MAQIIDPPGSTLFPLKNKLKITPVPYPSLRESDIMWSKRIWRRIDLREKINHPLYFPIEETTNYAALFDVIKQAISENIINAYDASYDDFRKQLTIEEVMQSLGQSSTTSVENPDNPGEYFDITDTSWVEARDIVAYEIKEEVFFDRQRSIIEYRIIGIAPIKISRDEEGNERGLSLLFWLYFPDCRLVFKNTKAFNTHNPKESLSYDDVFHKRRFNSFIVKESNVFDREISDYSAGLDALLESERIKEGIRELEMDLWHY
ncbi:MAG: gliding motility protein GldN [Bacteroidetes bacterium]|nr:gliding motility protein GldN [Bacteroidota bacterium]